MGDHDQWEEAAAVDVSAVREHNCARRWMSASPGFSIVMQRTVCWIVVSLLMLSACESQPPGPVTPMEPGPDSLDCPAPVETVYGRRIPRYAHGRQAVSRNGELLAYVDGETVLHVLNLKTMDDHKIDIESMLPESMHLAGISTIIWSPYDNTRLAMSAATLTDTVGDRKRYMYGHHLMMVDIQSGTAEIITPPIFNAGGSSGMSLIGWLVDSRVGMDSFLIRCNNPAHEPWTVGTEPFLSGCYVLQTKELIPSRFPEIGAEGHFQQSYNGDTYVSVVPSGGDQDKLHINEHFLNVNAALINKISWSPSGKKVALSVLPTGDGVHHQFEQIWISDVEKYQREHPDTLSFDVINLQQRFCMYSFLGCYAEFISDSTLAVSMHVDGGNSSLWEITTSGRKLRQLTFLP